MNLFFANGIIRLLVCPFSSEVNQKMDDCKLKLIFDKWYKVTVQIPPPASEVSEKK